MPIVKVSYMDVRRLRLLRDLSLYGTVSATAEALHLTAPAVSQQLAALEREAGLPLLAKQGRTLRFTPAGRRLVEHAEVILGGLAAAEADLQALRDGGRGLVRIAAFPSAARVLLPKLWSSPTLNEPDDRDDAAGSAGPGQLAGLDLRIFEHEPDAAIEALRRRQVDIAVAHAYSLLPRELPPGCEQHHLISDPVLLALPAGLAHEHGLAPGRSAELSRFAAANWLLPGPDTSCHELARRACGRAGFVPRPTALASDFSVLTALVAVGAGVALVPRMALPNDTRGVSLHPLADPLTRNVFAITMTGESRQPQFSRVLEALTRAGAEVTAALG